MTSGSVRNRLARAIHRVLRGEIKDFFGLTAPFRGNVDGIAGGLLQGWVVKRGSNEAALRVGLFVPNGLIASCIANQFRQDVKDAGFGDGHSGFTFLIDDSLLQSAIARGVTVSLRVMGKNEYEIGQVSFGSRSAEANGTILQPQPLHKLLFGDLHYLLSLNEKLTAEPLPTAGPKLTKHTAFFEHQTFDPENPKAPNNSTRLPAYVEYALRRKRMDCMLNSDASSTALDECLDWYLTHYASERHGRRVPLSKEVIDYLNAPISKNDEPFALARIMKRQLERNPQLLARLDVNNTQSLLEAIYWWAHDEAPQLYREDCLVPQRFIDALRAVPPARKDKAFPVNAFLDVFYKQHTEFAFLDLTHEADRETLTLALMVKAIKRPDLLRYLPEQSLLAAFECRDGVLPAFTRFVAKLAGEKATVKPITYERYTALLRLQGFDLPSRSFLSVTSQGNRLEAAALPVPSQKSWHY